MQDWFPEESQEKLKQNEREAAKEELEELGLATVVVSLCDSIYLIVTYV